MPKTAPWGSKYKIGLVVSSRAPSKDGQVQAFRQPLRKGLHSIVIATSEEEAKDIMSQKYEVYNETFDDLNNAYRVVDSPDLPQKPSKGAFLGKVRK